MDTAIKELTAAIEQLKRRIFLLEKRVTELETEG